jgi:hypothetical protein
MVLLALLENSYGAAMRSTLIVLASLAGLAMTGAPAMADSDCAGMRAALSAAVDEVLAQASAEPIVLADLTAQVDAADAALKALTEACGDTAKTATMPAASAVTGGTAGSGGEREQTERPSPADMMERTGRTHVTVTAMPEPHAASAAVFSQQAALLVADMRAAIAAGDLAGIRRIARDKAN